MGDVVRLGTANGSEGRLAAVTAALTELEEVRERLLRLAMGVAIAGVWRDWDERTPVGTSIELGVDSFAGCGDPVAEALARLVGEVEDRHAEIEAARARPTRVPRSTRPGRLRVVAGEAQGREPEATE